MVLVKNLLIVFVIGTPHFVVFLYSSDCASDHSERKLFVLEYCRLNRELENNQINQNNRTHHDCKLLFIDVVTLVHEEASAQV